MKDALLILSGILTIGSVVPYIRDIRKGKTKPNLVSWITWTLLTGMATAAIISTGDYRAAFFTGSAALATGAVVILGLKHGYVKYTRFDIICQIAAIVGLILWQAFDSPLIAVVASVIIDLVGALPTFRHSWLKPYEETWAAFALASVAAIIAFFALDSYSWTSVLYPFYIIFVNILMTATILISRHKHENKT